MYSKSGAWPDWGMRDLPGIAGAQRASRRGEEIFSPGGNYEFSQEGISTLGPRSPRCEPPTPIP